MAVWMRFLAAGLVVGLASMMVPVDPNAPKPVAGDPSGALPGAPAPSPKAIATATQPAILTVATPKPGALSANVEEASLLLTVRPDAVQRSESYLVNVYAVPKAEQAQGGAETLVGTFAFFPPPREGEARTFNLPAPDPAAMTGPDVTLRVELVPAAPEAKLEKSTLSVIDARIGTP